MPSNYVNLEPWLMNPASDDDAQGSKGATYVYQADSFTLDSNRPMRGQPWSDGLPVARTSKEPVLESNGLFQLTVVTEITSGQDDDVETVKESETASLEWVEVLQPLELHREFSPGGTKALTQLDFQHIQGWRGETDPTLKAFYKYILKDSDGNTVGAPITITGNALVFVKALQRGFDTYPDYFPLWKVRSVWRGNKAPPGDDIGIKGNPPGTQWPSGYEYRKADHASVQRGDTPKWDQDEAWQGATKVWIDRNNLYF